MVLGGRYFDSGRVVSQEAGYSNTAALGRVIYTDYLLPFELASVVLLVAIIAAIVLTLRERKDSKFMAPGDQVRVRREDRIRIVSMPTVTEAAQAHEPQDRKEQV